LADGRRAAAVGGKVCRHSRASRAAACGIAAGDAVRPCRAAVSARGSIVCAVCGVALHERRGVPEGADHSRRHERMADRIMRKRRGGHAAFAVSKRCCRAAWHAGSDAVLLRNGEESSGSASGCGAHRVRREADPSSLPCGYGESPPGRRHAGGCGGQKHAGCAAASFGKAAHRCGADGFRQSGAALVSAGCMHCVHGREKAKGAGDDRGDAGGHGLCAAARLRTAKEQGVEGGFSWKGDGWAEKSGRG